MFLTCNLLPETPVSVGDLVVGQHCFFDLGELFEVGLDVFQACGRRQTPHKNLFRTHYLRLSINSDYK